VAFPTHPSLQHLLQRPDIWRLTERGRAAGRGAGLATGFADLDAALHGGGWPRAALTEILASAPGSGELQLLLPTLAALGRQQMLQVWINPPFIPYAPALAAAGVELASLLIVRVESKQQLWTCEQALRCAACGAVLFWPSAPLRYAELRKLQVAAASQQALAFLLRDPRAAAQTSPAALRLQLQPQTGNQLSVQILKQRGTHGGQDVLLSRPALLNTQVPISQRPAMTSTIVADTEDVRVRRRDVSTRIPRRLFAIPSVRAPQP